MTYENRHIFHRQCFFLLIFIMNYIHLSEFLLWTNPNLYYRNKKNVFSLSFTNSFERCLINIWNISLLNTILPHHHERVIVKHFDMFEPRVWLNQYHFRHVENKKTFYWIKPTGIDDGEKWSGALNGNSFYIFFLFLSP